MTVLIKVGKDFNFQSFALIVLALTSSMSAFCVRQFNSFCLTT